MIDPLSWACVQFNDQFFAQSLPGPMVKEFQKSVNSCPSYGQESRVLFVCFTFFEPPSIQYLLLKRSQLRWNDNRPQETQLSLTNCSTLLCKCNSMAELIKTSPFLPTSYRTKFGRSALKGVGRRTPKIGEPWNCALFGSEAWLTPRYRPTPTGVTTSKLVVLQQKLFA